MLNANTGHRASGDGGHSNKSSVEKQASLFLDPILDDAVQYVISFLYRHVSPVYFWTTVIHRLIMLENDKRKYKQ